MRSDTVHAILALVGLLGQTSVAVTIQAGGLYQPGTLDEPVVGKVFSEAGCKGSELDSGWNPLDQCFYVKGGGKSFILKRGKSDTKYCLQRTKSIPCDCGHSPVEAKGDGECVDIEDVDPSRVQFSFSEGECMKCLDRVDEIVKPTAP